MFTDRSSGAGLQTTGIRKYSQPDLQHTSLDVACHGMAACLLL